MSPKAHIIKRISKTVHSIGHLRWRSMIVRCDREAHVVPRGDSVCPSKRIGAGARAGLRLERGSFFLILLLLLIPAFESRRILDPLAKALPAKMDRQCPPDFVEGFLRGDLAELLERGANLAADFFSREG